MEPRSFERGEEREPARLVPVTPEASMEPRSFERGEGGYQNPFQHTEL